MDLDLILQNVLNPPVLFFLLGAVAALVRSDLQIPDPVPKLLSMYLLLAIGFKGGVYLAQSGFGRDIALYLFTAVALASVIPLYVFYLLRRALGVYNAAAVCATYGSVSAITFITATALLDKLAIPYGGHAVAAMALMESPAIIIGVLLARLHAPVAAGPRPAINWGHLLHDAFCNGSVLLLLGSFLIGLATGKGGWKALAPFAADNFSGLLAFFLLDMGLIAGREFRNVGRRGLLLLAAALLIPLGNALLALLAARALGAPLGDAFLLVVLTASASYIAVPAAIRLAIPQAEPSVYVSMALAFTFPFNIIVGIPLYLGILRMLGS